MTDDQPDQRARPGGDRLVGWAQRRREKMIAEIERNRRGGHRVPTWALVVLLVAMIAAWAALVLLA
jgi:hypothetical protein